ALPAFALQKAVSSTITAHDREYFTGVVYTTNRRVWEHDKDFKAYLQRIRCTAIDMETATIFTVGFANHVPTGALLLVSDNPMVPEGVKTAESDAHVNQMHVGEHLRIGIESLRHIMEKRQPVKHLRF
ncbi:MAG: AMP nucleosidase, partial [Opitutaceae bacterium]|nr:AMP nucleosidase [Opitutaceae bacterium]